MKDRGFVLYQGPSALDGAPIVCIATLSSNNVKTGDMVQTWIIRSDIEPHTAQKTGADSSVCGDCPHRPEKMNTCYVTTFQAPLAVYRGFHRGIYCTDQEKMVRTLRGRKIRFGAYGDPAAVPFRVWESLAAIASGHTGYTHQENHPLFDVRLLDLVMVSVDTEKQAQETQGRYFRVKTPDAPALPGETECLSDARGMSCADCLLCDGTGRGKGKSVYINVHGAKAANFDLIAVG